MEVKPIASRQAFGDAIVKLGQKNEKVIVLDADLSKSTCTVPFVKEYPYRAFEMGVAEANMIGTAAGLALCGYVPFATSFACFLTGRFDQIKMSVAYANAPVRLVGTHAGVGIGPDGYSQQGLEDLALMRTLHNMVVLQPADDIETAQMVEMLCDDNRPAYLRLTRQGLPRVHAESYQFELGKFPLLHEGNDVSLFATGGTVGHAYEACRKLSQKGLDARLYNASSIKPIDVTAVCDAARETHMLFSIEDHNVDGGLGGAIAEVLAENQPAKLYRLGIRGEFGESGTPESLYKKHKLDTDGIIATVLERAGR